MAISKPSLSDAEYLFTHANNVVLLQTVEYQCLTLCCHIIEGQTGDKKLRTKRKKKNKTTSENPC